MHLCPVDGVTGDPGQKTKEFFHCLEERYYDLYEPGQSLSLDESLIRAFGRMKFKVRIITKSARYGIKLYVLCCAETGYVLKTIVYYGETTEGYDDSDDKGKIMQVVLALLEKYYGTWRTVHIDRGYGALDLSLELYKLGLHTNGTLMGNRVPQGVRMTSQSAKDLPRGSVQNHTYVCYIDGKQVKVGLSCWKDKKPVLLLTTCGDCINTEECRRRDKRWYSCHATAYMYWLLQ